MNRPTESSGIRSVAIFVSGVLVELEYYSWKYISREKIMYVCVCVSTSSSIKMNRSAVESKHSQ